MITYVTMYAIKYEMPYVKSYVITYVISYVISYAIPYVITYVIAYAIMYVITYVVTYAIMYVITYGNPSCKPISSAKPHPQPPYQASAWSYRYHLLSFRGLT